MGKSRSIFFAVRLLFSRVRVLQDISQVIPRLQFVYSKVVPIFPAVFAISMLSAEENQETKEDSVLIEAVKQADTLNTVRNAKESNEVEAVNNVYSFLMGYKDCKNAELLWRLSRATRDLAQLSVTDAKGKKSLTYESHEVAKRALELGEGNFSCHKWFAITLSDVGDYESTKQQISNAFIIQDHFKKAVDLNPLDASCYHLLGMWCFTIADVPWYKQRIASAIFATPPSSTFEEAIEYFERGEGINPGFYSKNQLMLATSNLRLKKYNDARRWLEQLSNYDSKNEEDEKAVVDAKELLKNC